MTDHDVQSGSHVEPLTGKPYGLSWEWLNGKTVRWRCGCGETGLLSAGGTLRHERTRLSIVATPAGYRADAEIVGVGSLT